MGNNPLHSRLCALDRSRGERSGSLRLGQLSIRLAGLDTALADGLRSRWGRFFDPAPADDTDCTVRVLADESGTWLEPAKPGEPYRLEALYDSAHRVIASYHFALCVETPPAHWRLAVVEQDDEPLQRVVENAVRFLAARLAIDLGGFAMHGAGILREGRVHVFAGSSGSGKSTAVRLTEDALSLGDDFAVVLPLEQGWGAPALPFDNSERIEGERPAGLLPVSGVWRLHKSDGVRIEYPAEHIAVASLLGCAAFPWAMPEQAPALLEHAKRFVSTGRFGHLHFTKETDLWGELLVDLPDVTSAKGGADDG